MGFRWDRKTFQQVGTWRYSGEAGASRQNGRELIMSDGTAELRFLDPETLQERRRVRVTASGRPVDRLNELEFVNGEVLANIWLTPRIARIDPATGNVTGWIDLTPLVRQTVPNDVDAVLNGIAYDASATACSLRARTGLSFTRSTWYPLPPRARLLPPTGGMPC
jgi:glutamine cyclotransferase